ncbi:receptor-like protein 53 [Alnus glutinosa]|uniref:receptor-like protein 53 n=1 Tax=Alnus glutinosa TaxID=3517 RepID=UPI002D797B12|nr:receptor-like protein 53 [Alnus glutinosa]
MHLIFTLSSPSMQPLCHHDDSSALLQFKESFIMNNSPSFYLPTCDQKVASWTVEGDKSDCCSWDGVECDKDTGHVIGLHLSNNCLFGSINSTSSLFRLVHLERLNLAYNNFNNSHIPSQVRDLSRLTHLDLSYSMLSGQIPFGISQLLHLLSLDLSYNSDLELKKPSLRNLVQNLTSLQKLDLSGVNISSTVPNILTNLSSLKSLSLGDCGLHGEFPVGIFKLSNLRFLFVRDNIGLTGYLPSFTWSSPLDTLDLQYTSFSGVLPASMGKLGFLIELNMRGCNISGSIPSSLGKLTKLTSLDLSFNAFASSIPSSLGNLTKLVHLDLSKNSFVGNVPPSLGNLTKLTYLDLSYNAFVGNVPPSLGNLLQLFGLDISNNQLTGPVPFELLNLPQLLFIYLSDNLLSSEMHFGLMNETRLTSLDLSNNRLTGPVTFVPMNLTQLSFLDLAANKLHGQISNSLFNLKNLEVLDLSENYLNGIVKFDEFAKLKHLNTLHISGNELLLLTKEADANATRQNFVALGFSSCNLSEFPNFLRNQHELEYLNMSNNKICGQVPEWMLNTSTTSLQVLDLSNNILIGFAQPPVFLPWTSLDFLDLSFNLLQGSLHIPPVSTKFFHISNNSLTGNIPELFCNLTSLEVLDLAKNNLSGSLPRCLDNFGANLSVLDLRRNKFQGSIPESWIKGGNLVMINFSQNKFQGHLPRSLAKCTMLKVIDLRDNQFIDIFPFWLGHLPNLEVLILRSNKFNGPVGTPQTYFKFTKMRILDISYNDFMGKLPLRIFENLRARKFENVHGSTYIHEDGDVEMPKGFGQFFDISHPYTYSMMITNKGRNVFYEKVQELFTAIDFSSNKFVGKIPESFGNLKGAQLLNLSNNNLIDHIPLSLGKLTELEALDLSQNKLSGEIPQQLTQLTFLEFFNVSHNNLTGPIPQGKQFDTFENDSFEGNPGLCGRPLTRKCGNSNEPSSHLPIFEENQDSGSPFEFGWKIVVIGYGFGFVVGVIIGPILIARNHDRLMKTVRIRPPSRRRR